MLTTHEIIKNLETTLDHSCLDRMGHRDYVDDLVDDAEQLVTFARGIYTYIECAIRTATNETADKTTSQLSNMLKSIECRGIRDLRLPANWTKKLSESSSRQEKLNSLAKTYATKVDREILKPLCESIKKDETTLKEGRAKINDEYLGLLICYTQYDDISIDYGDSDDEGEIYEVKEARDDFDAQFNIIRKDCEKVAQSSDKYVNFLKKFQEAQEEYHKLINSTSPPPPTSKKAVIKEYLSSLMNNLDLTDDIESQSIETNLNDSVENTVPKAIHVEPKIVTCDSGTETDVTIPPNETELVIFFPRDPSAINEMIAPDVLTFPVDDTDTLDEDESEPVYCDFAAPNTGVRIEARATTSKVDYKPLVTGGNQTIKSISNNNTEKVEPIATKIKSEYLSTSVTSQIKTEPKDKVEPKLDIFDEKEINPKASTSNLETGEIVEEKKPDLVKVVDSSSRDGTILKETHQDINSSFDSTSSQPKRRLSVDSIEEKINNKYRRVEYPEQQDYQALIDPPLNLEANRIDDPDDEFTRNIKLAAEEARQKKKERGKENIPQTPKKQKPLQLKKARFPWMAELSHSKPKDVDGVVLGIRKLRKVVLGHLNKLTPVNCERFMDVFYSLDLDKPQRFECFRKLVFRKAMDEPGYAREYAAIYWVVAFKYPKFINFNIDDGSAPELFKNLNFNGRYVQILNESNFSKKSKLDIELYQDMREREKKFLNGIRFMGYLYNNGVLPADNIKLFLNTCRARSLEIEALCTLLLVIGARMSSDGINAQHLLNSLEELAYSDDLADKLRLGSRIRLKLKQTVCASKNNWMLPEEETDNYNIITLETL